ncbi:MAG: hypothetical protein ACXWDI_11335 [Nocardioides sp.]
MRKLTMLTAGAAGYVLGARAGRERYEQIKRGAAKLKNNPTVQRKARDAGAAVKENAPVVKDKVTEAAASAKVAAQEKLDRSSSDDDTQATTPAAAAPYPRG